MQTTLFFIVFHVVVIVITLFAEKRVSFLHGLLCGTRSAIVVTARPLVRWRKAKLTVVLLPLQLGHVHCCHQDAPFHLGRHLWHLLRRPRRDRPPTRQDRPLHVATLFPHHLFRWPFLLNRHGSFWFWVGHSRFFSPRFHHCHPRN
uniref:Putative secreted protein n=1 Tax=Ixodes ricinus TaxID=34613 RepID=A0A147BEA6_IXORI